MKFEENGQGQPDETQDNAEGTERRKIYNVRMIVDDLPTIVAEAVYPFMSGSGEDNRNFDVQAFTRLVFVDEEKNTEPESPAITLRSDGFADLRPRANGDWKDVASDKQFKFPETEIDPNGLLITAYKAGGSWKPNVDEPRNVYESGKGFIKLDVRYDKPDPVTIIKRIEVYDIKKDPETGAVSETKRPGGDLYQIVLRPFNADGSLAADTAIPTKEMPETEFDALCAAHNIRPYLMVWVRVKDGEETVDMVPAMPDDDQILNGVENSWFSHGRVGVPFGNAEDQGRPVLHFPSKMLFSYANAKNKTEPGEKEWLYRSCYTVDPRYNWAPENWWFSTDEPHPLDKLDDVQQGGWYAQVFKEGGILDELAAAEVGANADNPRGDRARDPILFVSNLGYLQSVGELAFLPRLSLMEGNGANSGVSTVASRGILEVAADSEGYKGTFHTRATVQNMPCAGAAWKSYQNYRTNPNAFEFGANLYRRGLVNPRQGFYVNPFTQSKEVMLAAFANTPLNYWVAGTNYQAQGKSQTTKFESQDVFDADTSFRADYLAEYMMHRFKDLTLMLKIPENQNVTREKSYMIQRIWEDMFDALDWGGRLKQGNKTMNEIYAELAEYYKAGGGGESSYEEMYKDKNQYSDLNFFVTGNRVPGIELYPDLAAYGDEFADPLYYYNGRTPPSKDPTSGDYICDADRIFLHSYWRDCFANRQQLFLIFVRAESTALGGNGEGTPAQQGGRAVALVWRDPEAPQGDGEYQAYDVEKQNWEDGDTKRHPHKMRILFYRQFD